MHRAIDGVAVSIDHLHATAAQSDDVAVVKIDHAARLRDHRGDVGGEEVLALAQPDHERAAHARAGHRIGIVQGHHAQRVRAMQIGRGFLRRDEEVFRGAEVVMDEVRHHLGVGLRLEHVAQGFQPLALFLMVLDDAVVHHGNAAAGDVRMCIGLGHSAMGRPARVGNADNALEVLRENGTLHFGNAAHAAHALNGSIQDGHAGRVVAAILKALEPLREDGHDVTAGDGSDDSAHGVETGEESPIVSKKQALPSLGTGERSRRRHALGLTSPRGRGRGGNPRPWKHSAAGDAAAQRYSAQSEC